jgi:predicted NBD/HSP70 family sugar kinase
MRYSANKNIKHQIIILLQQVGPLSRAELARRTGLARSTITFAVGALIQQGIVAETEIKESHGRGRPSSAVSLAPGAGAAIGIDFGFRHVRGVIADLAHNILAVEELVLGTDYEVHHGIDAAVRIMDRLKDKCRIADANLLGVGVGLPCPTSLDGVTTRSAMIPGWSGTRVRELLCERISLPTVVENESRLGARGEYVWGAAKSVENFVYIKLHSGVGGAICAGGIFITGHNGGAGELGHISLDPAGPVCRCGNRGCLEVYAGIPAVLAQVRAAHPDITLHKLSTLYQSGDPATVRVMSDTAKRVAQAAAMLCNALNPELVLIGGSLAGHDDAFISEIRTEMQPLALELNRNPRVQRGILGRNASALGGVARVFELFSANQLIHDRSG